MFGMRFLNVRFYEVFSYGTTCTTRVVIFLMRNEKLSLVFKHECLKIARDKRWKYHKT